VRSTSSFLAAARKPRLRPHRCVNFGCTPSKALIRCARAVHEAGRGSEFGFRLDSAPRIDFGAVMERVRRMRSRSSEVDAVEAVERAGAEVYLGHARFIAPDIVEVDGRRLWFQKAVIATGTVPLTLPIDGLQRGGYLTNETVFSLTELPARLVVIGGGPLGCELAQAFLRLGSEVDLVSDTENLLPRDEPETSELIRRRFEREGMRLYLGFRAVRTQDGRLTVQSGENARGCRIRRDQSRNDFIDSLCGRPRNRYDAVSPGYLHHVSAFRRMENCERAERGPRQHHGARSRNGLARESEGWHVPRQGASPGRQWLDMPARRSWKASARPDVRGRDHDEVARGDPRREEA